MIVESPAGYELPLGGMAIIDSRKDEALTLTLAAAGRTATVRIESSFSGGATLGAKISRAHADRNGGLELSFSNGEKILVPADAQYEAWEVSSDDGMRAVSVPGNGVAIWQP